MVCKSITLYTCTCLLIFVTAREYGDGLQLAGQKPLLDIRASFIGLWMKKQQLRVAFSRISHASRHLRLTRTWHSFSFLA